MINSVNAIAFIGSVVFIPIVMFLLAHRYVDVRLLERHNDVAGFIYSVIGSIFGVLAAFVVVVVWEHHTIIEQAVQDEANVVMQIHRDANAFPSPFREALRDRMRDYALAVVANEVQDHSSDNGSEHVQAALDSLWRTYATFVPQDDNDRVWYAEILSRLNALARYREIRINVARHRIPTIMWIVLGIGGAITIGFSFLFGTPNTVAHILMIVGLSVTVSLSIVLVWSLSHPYSGLAQIDLSPMRRAVAAVGGG